MTSCSQSKTKEYPKNEERGCCESISPTHNTPTQIHERETMAKTSIRLKSAGSIWSAAEKWAAENHYVLETPGESTRLYLRKNKEARGKISVAISQVDEDVHIKAWFSDLIRDELELDSLSLYSALPRKEALSEIQELAAALGYIPPGKSKTKKKRNIAFNLGRSIRKLSGKK